jgi:hypothetical protein
LRQILADGPRSLTAAVAALFDFISARERRFAKRADATFVTAT